MTCIYKNHLKKTPSPKFGLESQLWTSDLEFVNTLMGIIGSYTTSKLFFMCFSYLKKTHTYNPMDPKNPL